MGECCITRHFVGMRNEGYPKREDYMLRPAAQIDVDFPVSVALVGGFLGAGKTTAIGRLARALAERGRRVAVITNGGGAGVICADEVARHGLELAEFPPELYAALDEILPPFWSKHNPLDMVATGGGDVAPRVLKLVAECDSVDAIVVLSCLGVPNSGSDDRPVGADGEYLELSPWETAFMELVADLMERTGKPILNVPDLPLRKSVYDLGRRYRPIVLATPQAAARAIDRMQWYGARRGAGNPLA